MKFSSQEEYGLRCLLQLAKRGESTSLTIPEIARLEGITTTHAAKLLMVLRKAEFITSERGQSGGYTLARPAKDIVVGHVLEALGGKLYDDDFCGKHTGSLDICTHAVDCSVKSLWQIIQQSVDSVTERLTLADMLEPDQPNVVFFSERPKAQIK